MNHIFAVVIWCKICRISLNEVKVSSYVVLDKSKIVFKDQRRILQSKKTPNFHHSSTMRIVGSGYDLEEARKQKRVAVVFHLH